MEKRKIKSLSKTSKERIKNYSVVRYIPGSYYFITPDDHIYKLHSSYSVIKFNLSHKEAWDFVTVLEKLKGK